MKTILKTTYPCLIKTDSQICEINETDNLEIIEEKHLIVFPKNNQQIPFLIDLTNLKESQYYSLAVQNETTFIILERRSILESYKKIRLTFNNNVCKISLSSKKLVFETKNKRIIYKSFQDLSNCKVYKIKNFAVVEFENNLYLYSMLEDKLYHLNGEKINISNDKITVFKNIKNSIHEKKEVTYKIDDKITNESEKFYYKQFYKTQYEELIPYKFLESIQVNDSESALSFLSTKLKENMTENKLKRFFEKIETFSPITKTEFIIYGNNRKKYVAFQMDENKINDITIDNL